MATTNVPSGIPSTIQVSQYASYWAEYHPVATAKLQSTISNTDSDLDNFIVQLLNKINKWEDFYSVTEIQSFLGGLFQSRILGVVVPDCYDLINADGFLKHIATVADDYKWNVEFEIDEENSPDPVNPTYKIKCQELEDWIERIDTFSTETSNKEALSERTHIASSNHVYNVIFRPNTIAGVTTGNALEHILETLGYEQLYVLNPHVPKPDYKRPELDEESTD